MNVTNEIEIHLDDKRHMPPIDVMQGDSNTRVLELSLYSGGHAWNVPEGVSVAVAYRRPDGAKGAYDTLADGSAAISVTGNVVSAILVPQVLAVAGNTKLTVVFSDDTGNQLATFCVIMKVEYNPAIGAVAPEDYINLRQHIAEVMAELGAAGTFRIAITTNPWAADKTFAEIYAAYEAGQVVECVLNDGRVLPLVAADAAGVVFQSVLNREYQRILIKADNSVTYTTGQYALSSEIVADFTVCVVENGDGSGSSDVPVDDIRNAYDTGRVIHCELEMQDQYYVELPFVKMRGGIFYFAAICDGVEWLVKITADEAGETAVTVTQRTVGAGSGGAGEDGGYYTPAVTDNGNGTMTVSFEPTKEEMDAVDPQTIALPAGPQGPQGPAGIPGADGYTPVRGTDYWTEEDQQTIKDDARNYIATELAKRGQLKPEFAQTIEECTDTTKLYVLPDGFIYAYMETTVVNEPENMLTFATDTDRKTVLNGVGYATDTRLSSSGGTATASGVYATGFIPVKENDVLTIEGLKGAASGTSLYVIAYDASNAKTGHKTMTFTSGGILSAAATAATWYTIDQENNIATIPLTSANFGSGFNAIRFSMLSVDGLAVYVNKDSYSGTTTEKRWVSTGHAFVPADYEDRIIAVEKTATEHTARIVALEKTVTTGGADETETAALTRIKEWDKPVYDPAPVTLIADDRVKPALPTEDRTIEAIYAKYRALMANHPNYITETNMGKSASSDTFAGVDMLRFDFREPDGLTQPDFGAGALHETKPTIIFLSGIHAEWVGVWGLYYALEEIATNPAFDDVRRNAHIVVIPCANPYCLAWKTAIDGWRMSHVNANGVAIHNNFGVDHRSLGTVGEYNYGGSTPYSEPETQYIDAVMAEYPDAVAFVSCHNNDYSTYYGSHVIWASSATYHMCNMTFRLVDKMTKAWIDKYGDTLKTAIDQYKINMDANDYRLGRATISSSKGTEQKNATKYGIQGVNLEISRMMKVFSGNTDGSSEVMTHGAEVYANFMRTLLWSYDHKDKKEYAPNLPWSE